MKIAIIVPKEYPVPAVKGGAVESLITDLINHNEKKKKIDLDIITIKDTEAEKIRNKYEYTHFLIVDFDSCFIFRSYRSILEKFVNNFKFFRKVKNYIQKNIYEKSIIKFLKEKDYDFVITEGGNIYEYDKVYAMIEKKKSILHIHGKMLGNEYFENKYEYFLCISEYIKQKFTENLIISENRTRCLYNGISIEKFDKELTLIELEKMKNKYKINTEDSVLIFCGRTIPEKGVKELLIAFKGIVKKRKVKLLIVGSSSFAKENKTEYEKELILLAEEIKDKVIFTGYVPNDELYKFYKLADVAVFPHLCEEAFGLTLVEAMASGIPIITTNSGAIPEVVSDKCAVILNKEPEKYFIKQLEESILNLLEDKELRKKMALLGKKRASMFSTQNYYDNFVGILEELKNENRNIDISKCS